MKLKRFTSKFMERLYTSKQNLMHGKIDQSKDGPKGILSNNIQLHVQQLQSQSRGIQNQNKEMQIKQFEEAS